MDQVRYILTDSSSVDVCIFTETFLSSSHNIIIVNSMCMDIKCYAVTEKAREEEGL